MGVQHTFQLDSYDGSGPAAGVVLDKAGNLYGTTGGGGTAQSCDGFYSLRRRL